MPIFRTDVHLGTKEALWGTDDISDKAITSPKLGDDVTNSINSKADKDDTYTKDEVDAFVERIDNDIEGTNGAIDGLKDRIDLISQLQISNEGASANDWGTFLYNKIGNGCTASVAIYDNSDEVLEILGDQDTLLGTAKVSTDGNSIDINASCGHGYFQGTLHKTDGAWTVASWNSATYDSWKIIASSSRDGLMSKSDKSKLDRLSNEDITKLLALINN